MITSTSNIQVKNIIQLLKKAKQRKEQDIFIAEGTKMFLEVPEERLIKVFVSETFFSHHKKKLEEKGRPVEILSDAVFKYMSDTQAPQGILCLIKQYHYELEELLAKEHPMLLFLENMQDPGNLGTIVRTAEGAGADGIFLTDNSVDIYNPKTIRSTMGSIYRLPFLYVPDFLEAVKALRKRKIPVYAAHLKGEKYYDEFSYLNGCAFLIGNEGNGLSEETAALADTYLKIPMAGKVESLNAAVAASILMYEAARQRR